MNLNLKHDQAQAGYAHLALMAVLAVAVVAGAGVFVYGQQKKAGSVASTESVSAVSLNTPLPTDLIGFEKVRQLAAADKPGTVIREVELETEDGQLLYKVKLADGSFVLYNARSGVKVTKATGDAAKIEQDDDLPAGFKPSISFDQARQTALKQKPGGTISKIELEMEEGKAVYSVRFSDEARVDVDAMSGAIVRTRAAKKSPAPASNPDRPASSSGSGSGSSGSGSSSGNHSDDSSPSDGSDSDSDDNDDSDDDSGSGSNSGSNSGSGSGR